MIFERIFNKEKYIEAECISTPELSENKVMKEKDEIIKFIGECDEPIKHFEDDSLSLDSQIEGFADFIKSCDTPMTISIEGDWGSGKTSFYNAVKDTIVKEDPKKEKYLFVEFNAWQYSQFKRSDSLAIDLFYTIIKMIEKEAEEKGDKPNSEQSMKTKELKRRLGRLAQAAVVGITSYIQQSAESKLDLQKVYSILKDSSEISEAVQKLGQTEPTEPNGIEIISTLKNDVQNCIESYLKVGDNTAKKNKDTKLDGKEFNTDKRLIVFVDDLDRLVPDKAVEMMEALKVFLDCKFCVFILAIDYKVVVNGVSMKYKDSINRDKGNDFFEKIIQVVYKVPTVMEHSDSFIAEILRKHNVWPIVTKEFTTLLRTSGKDSPRAVKRLLNTYLLLRKVAEKQGPPAYERDEDILYPNPDTDAYLFAFLCLRESNETLYNEFIAHFLDPVEEKKFMHKMNELKNWLYLISMNDSQQVKDGKTEENQNQDLEKLRSRLSVFLEQIKVLKDDIECEKKRRFLLTFFKTLMADKGENVINTSKILTCDISDDLFINRIRSALLLSDISGTSQSFISLGEYVSALLLYRKKEEGDDCDVEIITFVKEPGTFDKACKKTIELILVQLPIPVVEKMTKTGRLIFKDKVQCKYDNPLEVSPTWPFSGDVDENGDHKGLTQTYYIDSEDIEERIDIIDTLAQLAKVYVEWRRGRSMELIEKFGDLEIKKQYE